MTDHLVTKHVYNKNYQMITSLDFMRALIEESKVEKGISSASQSSGLFLLDIPNGGNWIDSFQMVFFIFGGGGGVWGGWLGSFKGRFAVATTL